MSDCRYLVSPRCESLPSEQTLIIAPRVGVVFGSVVTGLSPSTQIVGSTFTLSVEGEALGSVTDVAFVPDDGISVLSAPVPAPDGLSVTADISIDATAPETLREVVVSAGAVVIGATPGANRFQVTPLLPIVDAITPNFVIAGAPAAPLTLVGGFLDGVTAVRVEPPDDLSIGGLSVNAEGTQLIVDLSAGVSAVTGPRVVIAQTPSGESDTAASPANTLTVGTQSLSAVDPIACTSAWCV